MNGILLVDDNAELARFAALAIRRSLPEQPLRLAASCGEARQVLTEACPQTLILDEHLPDGSGLALAAEIDTLQPPPRVILISGDQEAEARAHAEGLRPDVVLQKPFSVGELVRHCERLASGARAGLAGAASSRGASEGMTPGRHHLLNRLSGLLAGLQALRAELEAEAEDPVAVRGLAAEYLPPLTELVKEISGIVKKEPQHQASGSDGDDAATPSRPAGG
jgi:DNA-binding response OmpR family regulator